MRAVAREESVALIDLNPMSMRFYEALGPEVSPRAFADEGRDKTHHNEYGAYALARMVVEGLRAADPAAHRGPREASRRGRRQLRSFASFPAHDLEDAMKHRRLPRRSRGIASLLAPPPRLPHLRR